MTPATVDRLRTLGLGSMSDAYLVQRQDASTTALGFDERFSMLVDAEHHHRHNRALTRRLKEAKLRVAQAYLEDLDPNSRRGLEQALVRQPPAAGSPSIVTCSHRCHRRRQDLSRVRARAASVPAKLPCPVSPGAAAL